MKKQLSIIAALMLLEIFSPQAWGRTTYSTIAPSGQTIYYWVEDHIIVTYPGNPVWNPGWGGYTMPTGSLVIPDSITHGGVKYLVTAIDNVAFAGCTGLTSVTIPSSVTSIGSRAFWDCTGLTTVNFNADSCTFAGSDSYYRAFDGCTYISTFNFGSNVKVIPSYLCYGMTGLTSITIPNSVTSIGEKAFYGCTGLTAPVYSNTIFAQMPTTYAGSYSIPDGITTIRGNAFDGCNGLSSITIPSTVTYIEGSAFSGCTGLTTVNFNADSCTLMGRQYYPAFQGCTNLVTLNIGNNVKTVPSYAFSRCSHLSEIHSPSRVAPPLGSAAFDGVPSTIPVHIPCGSSASYYSRWSYFSNFVEEAGFTFTATSDNEQQGTVQILTMPTCTSPQAVLYATANSGYRFDHWSDGSTSNPYSLTVTDDLDLIGYFVADGTEGISDIDADGLRIHSENGRIAIEGAEGEAVAIYDMMGRLISGMWIVKGGKQELAVPTGVYLVRIGDKTARKVVVL